MYIQSKSNQQIKSNQINQSSYISIIITSINIHHNDSHQN
jgi:pimeloyl-ACP methyl ester carboxylesterase